MRTGRETLVSRRPPFYSKENYMVGVNVKSEINTLKKVILHRPGRELLNLTPETLGELLFDDIPFLKVAREEHDAFAKTLTEHGAEVVYLEDLVAEVLDRHPELRKQFLEQFIAEADIHTDYYHKIIFDYLNNGYQSSKDLVLKTMEGITLSELPSDKNSSLVDLVSDASKMVIPPIPNIYFTRDPFAMIGNGVSLNKMYSTTRCRETIYGEYIFRYHPDFKAVPQYYSRYNPFHIEGGDILNLSEEIIAIGISQRTQPDAIDQIAQNIFSAGQPIKTILAFNIPNSRAFMHLDTVFTQIDYDKFTVHPGILGPLTVFEVTPDGKNGLRHKQVDGELPQILKKYLGRDVEVIPCAGGDQIASQREQWNDGSNTLCVSPGTVIVYERNDITNALLRKRGLNVLEIPSAELSRGRGGPRCMSMPVWREEK
jgi:arginine deiminase